jgi:hypothetical protein
MLYNRIDLSRRDNFGLSRSGGITGRHLAERTGSNRHDRLCGPVAAVDRRARPLRGIRLAGAEQKDCKDEERSQGGLTRTR